MARIEIVLWALSAYFMTMVNIDRGHTIPRRERKRHAIRARLYQAALDSFRQRGYDHTTVSDITDAADVAKGTFFNYFPTKEHVLVAYHDEMTAYLLSQLGKRHFRNAESAVRAAFRECAGWVERDVAMAQVVLRVMFGSRLMLDADHANEKRFVAWFREQLIAGVERGELRKNLDVELLVELLLNALSSTVMDWAFRTEKFDLESRLLAKVRFLFLAARTGAS